jgi:Uma2 family endonuclease
MASAAVALAEPMTVEEFLAFVDRRPDERYELIDGQPVMMAGVTIRHADIVGNIFASLRPASRSKGCRAVASDVLTGKSFKESFAAAPDVMVICEKVNELDRLATKPAIVVEVLSKSTMWRDRGVKFEAYKAIPSLTQIVFVYQDQVRVESWTRADGPDIDGDDWALDTAIRLSDSVTFVAIGHELPASEIYADTELAAG